MILKIVEMIDQIILLNKIKKRGDYLKSPINWFGGKYYMANKIIELFPKHRIYVEVFGGAGHIFF
jgi:DNA adenine methylase